MVDEGETSTGSGEWSVSGAVTQSEVTVTDGSVTFVLPITNEDPDRCE